MVSIVFLNQDSLVGELKAKTEELEQKEVDHPNAQWC